MRYEEVLSWFENSRFQLFIKPFPASQRSKDTMREPAFREQNRQRWIAFEDQLKEGANPGPDEMADIYVEVSEDLAYARTYYSGSKAELYLNNLAARVHEKVYRNRKEKKSRFAEFWLQELPLLMYQHRKQLYLSFVMFMVPVFIGALSAAVEPSFVRFVLGDYYVEMTLSNIEKGDPMAVYKGMDSFYMFLRITINNIAVSFKTFLFGIIGPIGTLYILFVNGVMVGSFQYFFVNEGEFLTSLLAIWIHGTLEISAIIIAGCAGLVFGNSFVFPGTYSRWHGFKKGARDGLKILLGLVPVFIAAGFLESFVTRHYQLNPAINLTIIILSALFIVGYFLIYPVMVNKRLNESA